MGMDRCPAVPPAQGEGRSGQREGAKCLGGTDLALARGGFRWRQALIRALWSRPRAPVLAEWFKSREAPHLEA